MRTEVRQRGRSRDGEQGQISIFVLLALSTFLLGFVGFAVDMTNLWFHRQTSQGAADAACQAGIMNVLVAAQGSPTPTAGFTPGVGFDCSAQPAAAPCRYANLNGYNGAGLVAGTASNQVTVSFPGGVGGVTPPDLSLAPVPFMRADVRARVRLTFASLITGLPTSDVHAFAECGIVQTTAPIPIIVLNPTCSHPFQMSGSGELQIVGGPTKSVQVNSNNACASATTNAAGGCSAAGPTIDLSQGGPNFTGSVFGSFGGPSPAPSGFVPGATGSWAQPAAPIQDPYKLLPPPAVPPLPTASALPTGCLVNVNPCPVLYTQGGCPDLAGCLAYRPGLYTQPISVKGVTAIFVPGIYYLQPTAYTVANGGLDNCGSPGSGCTPNPTGQCNYDFAVDSNGIVRISTDPGDGSGGVMFYLSGPGSGSRPYGSVFFGSNAGKPGGRIVDPYIPAGNATSRAATCPGGFPPNPPLPASLLGNILLAPCSGIYGDPLGQTRGVLFFQDRANADKQSQASMQGGGGLLLAGTLYFHNCPNSLTAPCSAPPIDYNAFFQLQGNPGSETRVIGNIITDQLVIAGNGQITMVLDPNALFVVLKATLLR